MGGKRKGKIEGEKRGENWSFDWEAEVLPTKLFQV